MPHEVKAVKQLVQPFHLFSILGAVNQRYGQLMVLLIDATVWPDYRVK